MSFKKLYAFTQKLDLKLQKMAMDMYQPADTVELLFPTVSFQQDFQNKAAKLAADAAVAAYKGKEITLTCKVHISPKTLKYTWNITTNHPGLKATLPKQLDNLYKTMAGKLPAEAMKENLKSKDPKQMPDADADVFTDVVVG